MNRCVRCFGDLNDLAVFCPHCAQAHEPDFSQLLNQIISTSQSEYRLNRRLGQGGLSTVFSASDLQTDQIVVVKVSNPAQLARRELSYAIESDEARRYWNEMLERMKREAEALAEIDHPNIVRFFGTGTIGEDLRFVVMEYLRGQTLRQEIDGKGRLDQAGALRIAFDVSSALSEIHQRGIVHRDINPRNIFLDCGLRFSEGGVEDADQSADQSGIRHSPSSVKLLDFGIAKFPQPPGAPPFTQYSVLSGTVAYASPEQCQSRPLDHRADIYSFGVVLYEMLTGQRPFEGRTPTEIALKQIQAEPTPLRVLNPGLSAGIEQVVLRALAKNPEQRQQNIEELASELRAGGRKIIIPLNGPLISQPENLIQTDKPNQNEISEVEFNAEEDDEKRKFLRRRRRWTVGYVAAAVLVFGSGVLLGRQLTGSNPQPLAAQSVSEVMPSPTPLATVPAPQKQTSPTSDPDSLELAAKLSHDNAGSVQSTPVPMVTRPITAGSVAFPPKTQTARTVPSVNQSKPSGNQSKPSGNQSKPSGKNSAPAKEAKNHSASLPPKIARLEPPPTPAPNVAVNRIPQPVSQPDLSQAPRKEEIQQVARRENDNPPRHSQGPLSDSRSQYEKAEKADQADQEKPGGQHRRVEQLGPKLIQWSGSVNRERVIKIEMPGVPGVIEIPRTYRDRVGVIEPPADSNGWGSATLRIFGKGNVSILLRWWPLVRGEGG